MITTTITQQHRTRTHNLQHFALFFLRRKWHTKAANGDTAKWTNEKKYKMFEYAENRSSFGCHHMIIVIVIGVADVPSELQNKQFTNASIQQFLIKNLFSYHFDKNDTNIYILFGVFQFSLFSLFFYARTHQHNHLILFSFLSCHLRNEIFKCFSF